MELQELIQDIVEDASSSLSSRKMSEEDVRQVVITLIKSLKEEVDPEQGLSLSPSSTGDTMLGLTIGYLILIFLGITSFIIIAISDKENK